MSATAYNNGNHDARLLYIIELAPCREHHGTLLKDARHGVIPVNVMRNGLQVVNELRF